MFIYKKNLRTIDIMLFASMFISACTPTTANRGHIIQDEAIADIVAGRDTQRSVIKKIGSPSTISTLDSSIWYYIGLTTQKRGILDEEQISKKVIRVKFDEEGKVLDIAEVTKEDVNIPISKDKTHTGGSKVTLAQQFFGNLGKFNSSGGGNTE
tara:strand:+ start:318 stop:779 length:462 start_codon:yes stop_codon:yes gene_type:complete